MQGFYDETALWNSRHLPGVGTPLLVLIVSPAVLNLELRRKFLSLACRNNGLLVEISLFSPTSG
jgi:hypothetical protein